MMSEVDFVIELEDGHPSARPGSHWFGGARRIGRMAPPNTPTLVVEDDADPQGGSADLDADIEMKNADPLHGAFQELSIKTCAPPSEGGGGRRRKFDEDETKRGNDDTQGENHEWRPWKRICRGTEATEATEKTAELSKARTECANGTLTSRLGQATMEKLLRADSVDRLLAERRKIVSWQPVQLVRGAEEIVFEYGLWAPMSEAVFRPIFDLRRLDGMLVNDSVFVLRAAVKDLASLGIEIPKNPPEDKTRRTFSVFAWYVNILTEIAESYRFTSTIVRPLTWRLPASAPST